MLNDLDGRQEPRRSAFPKPGQIMEVKAAVDALRLNETQQLVEQVGASSKQSVCCKDCGQVIVANATNLRQVAKKQKGCLYGLLLEALKPESISLDTNKGQPGSRHVLCRKCGRKLGRWAQPGATDKKFTPGFVFISTNVVK